jgi:uncharacterized membrane protein YedE/YeeE
VTGWLPWWLAAAALGAVTVGHWLAVRRPLGVSSVLGRFAALSEEREAERSAAALHADEAALEAAMLAATAAAAAAGDLRTADAAPVVAVAGRLAGPLPSLSAHGVFLVALAAGGLAARVFARGPAVEPGLPATLVARLGTPGAVLSLAAGGALVGFGTAACGGCSAGHGLTGCARLSPVSLVATATFFCAALATSLLLARLA